MKSAYTDLRVARTKEAIRDALTELINEKGFDSITVKDITARANINRGTFYLHYRDKYDLFDLWSSIGDLYFIFIFSKR
ncbi:hypothetical protein IGA_00005 [Bacillus cereus HuA3-9]|uniref:HTH tetR-type domain-containing protein n=3 Tax=Bacillus cereus group TaxID=86661 RepID=J8DPJ9_BACCE|nr:Transcriptional regulator, TetR [Bacillus mycoides]EJQ78135.1 hypothetical protein IGC_03147 [Bacillus cereus HuA4-10]EOO22804.1 hypothetical protein IGA_00005 [Bacillus cereus HuA3-9]MBK5432334.1 helix-turn-helix transcriptional regulator [Bacillus sp. TH25]